MPSDTSLRVTIRPATRHDLPAITSIETEASLNMPSERVHYANLDRYPQDRQRCWKYNYACDYWASDVFVSVAELEHKEEKTVVGFLAWEYDPDKSLTSPDASLNIRKRAGPLYDHLPRRTWWRRLLEWWYIKCFDVAYWFDRSRTRPEIDVDKLAPFKPTGDITQEQLDVLMDGECWYLLDLAVFPKYQKLGIGSTLVRWGLDRMMTDESSSRVLRVMLNANPGTQDYYTKKFGFEEISRQDYGGFVWSYMILKP